MWPSLSEVIRTEDYEAEMTEYIGFLEAVDPQEALSGRDLPLLQRVFEAIDTIAVTHDETLLRRLIDAFLRLFPNGGVELIRSAEDWERAWMMPEALTATSVVTPSEFLRHWTRRSDRRHHITVASALEAVLQRDVGGTRTGFLVQRFDRSLLFTLGATVELKGIGRNGVSFPRGMNFPSLSTSDTLTYSRLNMSTDKTRQYIVRAAAVIQRALFRMMDPLGFTTSGKIDPFVWEGVVRTVERISELTYLCSTTTDSDARTEVFLSLIDLYAGLGIPLLPSDRWLEGGRGWLPDEMRSVEFARTKSLRADVIDEIWQGVMFGRDGDVVTLPDDRRISKEKYASEFIYAFRNALTHGYHPRERRRIDGMRSVLSVHSGKFPSHFRLLAQPMFGALLGDVDNWTRKYTR